MKVELLGWLTRGLCEIRVLDGLTLIVEILTAIVAVAYAHTLWLVVMRCPACYEGLSSYGGEYYKQGPCKRCDDTRKRFYRKPEDSTEKRS